MSKLPRVSKRHPEETVPDPRDELAGNGLDVVSRTVGLSQTSKVVVHESHAEVLSKNQKSQDLKRRCRDVEKRSRGLTL